MSGPASEPGLRNQSSRSSSPFFNTISQNPDTVWLILTRQSTFLQRSMSRRGWRVTVFDIESNEESDAGNENANFGVWLGISMNTAEIRLCKCPCC